MWEKSGNPFLASTAGNPYNLSVRIWYVFMSRIEGLWDTVFEHNELLEAIRDGDGDPARVLAEEHVERWAESVRQVL